MNPTYRAGDWRVAVAADGTWGVFYGMRLEPVCTFLSRDVAMAVALEMAETQPASIHQQAISGEMN